MRVASGTRQGDCVTGGTNACNQWFAYDWDETGRLMRARRWDFEGPLPALGGSASPSERPVPAETPTRDLAFAYSLGERVLKWTTDEAGAVRTTADVFPTLRLEDVAYDDQYAFYTPDDEQVRLYLGGLAEVRYDPSLPFPLPAPYGEGIHVFLVVPDHLGSSTAIIDHLSGELVERVTYQAYGAVESDYRPARWASHRLALRFTGKEDDTAIGLTYFGARYYAPNLGQWASADPLTIHGMGADPNPYAYVSGRVMTHVDPFGLDCTGTSFHVTGKDTTVAGSGLCGSSEAADGAASRHAVTAENLARGTAHIPLGSGGAYFTPNAVRLATLDAVVDWTVAVADPTHLMRAMTQLGGLHLPRFLTASSDPDDKGSTVGPVLANTALLIATAGISKSAEGVKQLAAAARGMQTAAPAAGGPGGLVRGAENVAKFGSLNEARAAARQLAGLGDDVVKYVSEVGPMRGQVVGSASRDGLRGWRIDFDPTKGFHVNWWDKSAGAARSTWTYGANIIEGGTEGDFLNLLQHFQ